MPNYKSIYANLLARYPEFHGIKRYCNICGFRFAKFAPVGARQREGMCPVCGSFERHRHMFVLIAGIYQFLKGKKVLHFAPEAFLKDVLRKSGAEYYDADLDAAMATWQVDITNISFEENYFDYIFCSHVLEHIPDDIRAMKELYRVLKAGGTAILAVPLFPELVEDDTVTDPEQRLALFGQRDHVRKYDLQTFVARLSSVGFDTCRISHGDQLPELYRDAKAKGVFVLARKH